jgi:predicted metalloendopeptidase
MFSCGGWKREYPIPDSQSSWGQVEEIKLRNIKTMRRLLESKETRAKYSQVAIATIVNKIETQVLLATKATNTKNTC